MLREHSQMCQRQGEPLLLASQLCIHTEVRKNTFKKEKPQKPQTFTPHLRGNFQAQPLQARRLTSQSAGTKQARVALGDKQALSPSCVITYRAERAQCGHLWLSWGLAGPCGDT